MLTTSGRSAERVGGREGIRTPGLRVANEAAILIRHGAATAQPFKSRSKLGNLGNRTKSVISPGAEACSTSCMRRRRSQRLRGPSCAPDLSRPSHTRRRHRVKLAALQKVQDLLTGFVRIRELQERARKSCGKLSDSLLHVAQLGASYVSIIPDCTSLRLKGDFHDSQGRA